MRFLGLVASQGGLFHLPENTFLKKVLQKRLNTKIFISDKPEFCGAIGAGLFAVDSDRLLETVINMIFCIRSEFCSFQFVLRFWFERCLSKVSVINAPNRTKMTLNTILWRRRRCFVKCSEYFFNFFFLFVHLISPCSISFRKEKAAAEAPLPPSLNG